MVVGEKTFSKTHTKPKSKENTATGQEGKLYRSFRAQTENKNLRQKGSWQVWEREESLLKF